MALEDYRRKRDFDATSEPEGGEADAGDRRFVVHEHHASRLHFDLRLEMGGALKSWAIPKGPSMNPADKRLAVMVEDHPLEYIDFRGEIAEGNYGAGEVAIWDSGTYEPVEGALDTGKFVFELVGAKLKGQFHMVRLKNSQTEWLLIKGRDEFADPNWKLEQILPGGSRNERKELKDEGKGRKGGASAVIEPPRGRTASDPMPRTISPMLATLTDRPFSDPEWLFEIKWDGYRAISFIKPDEFRLVSRRNESLIDRFPQAEAIPGFVAAETAIIDGEMVAVKADGKPSFQLLQNAARGLPHDAQLVYYVFDLLYLNGEDLRKRPLRERKQMLSSIVRESGFVKYSDHVIGKGEQLFDQASKQGLEGVMAKRADSPYLEKRSSFWLKVKAVKRQEFVIGGYTEPRHSREYFGALVIGVYDGDRLQFAGQVGGGFDDQTLREVYELLQPSRTDRCPFASEPKTNEPATWVKPELVCEVKFAEWTDEGILRQPVFLGLRTDKSAREVVREMPKHQDIASPDDEPRQSKQRAIPAEEAFARETLKGDLSVDVDGITIALTNLDKVYWPRQGYTKGDMLRYYYRMREVILPHVAGRPLIMQRFPDGIDGESFYQHNLDKAPEFVTRVPITEGGATVNYAVIDSPASLLYTANLGCIAQNPFHSRVGSLDRPDWIVIDLDPEDATFAIVCEVALVVKGVLDEAALQSYAKTSGSRGMHIYIPVDPIYTYEQTQGFGTIVASLVAHRVPDKATVERMVKERDKGQVYVDYMQNAEGKTIAGPYSVRACPGATVSTPLPWEEVESKPGMGQYTMFTVPDRVTEIGDIFRPTLSGGQKLAGGLERLEALLAEVRNFGEET